MKLSRYVLAICVLVLAFTPFISNAAEIGSCNQPSQVLNNDSLGKSDLRGMLNGLINNGTLDPQENTCIDNTCDLNGCTQAECDQSVCEDNTCDLNACVDGTCNLNSDAFNMNDILSQLKFACTK